MDEIKKQQPETLADASLRDVADWLLSQVNSRDKGTVQNWLSKILAETRMVNLKASMNKDRLKWFVDLQSEEAGLWLRDIPKKGCGFKNDEMKAALRFRLYLPMSNLQPESKCSAWTTTPASNGG